MTRQQAEPSEGGVHQLGSWIGESLGQGIAEGIQGALAQVSQELAPLVGDLARAAPTRCAGVAR